MIAFRFIKRQLITAMMSALAFGNALAAPRVVLKLDDMNVADGKEPQRWQRFTRFFKECRQDPPACHVIQGHPNSWDEVAFAEYSRIVDFLTTQGWRFVPPTNLPGLLK